MAPNMSLGFAYYVEELVDRDGPNLEDDQVLSMINESWKLVEENDQWKQLDQCIKNLYYLNNEMIEMDADTSLFYRSLAQIIDGVIVVIKNSAHREKGLTRLFWKLVRHHQSDLEKRVIYLSQVITFGEDDVSLTSLQIAAPGYYSLLAKVTERCTYRLMLTESDLEDEAGLPIIITKQLPTRERWIFISGIYLTKCFGPLCVYERRSLSFKMEFREGDRPWKCDKSYYLEPDLNSPLETIEYGDDFGDHCQVHLPSVIRDLLERASIRSRAKSARS